MFVKKFIGYNQFEVLERIKRELGSEAVILHTSFVRPRGPLKWFGASRCEIVAGTGFKIVKEVNGRDTRRNGTPDPSERAIREELDNIKKMLQAINERMIPVSGPMEHLLGVLSQYVSESLARRLIEKMPPGDVSADGVRRALRNVLKIYVKTADGIEYQPGRCTRVATIGPTGVGKTTTIAKLMSVYSYRGKRVAVLTNDNYRIAAVEQLKRICELVSVPFEVCATPDQVRAGVAKYSDYDLLLVDTAGRSQRNLPKITELKEILAAVEPDETHLVLSMTTDTTTLTQVVEHFGVCNFNRLVLTKLDEAVKLGVVLDVLSKVNTRVSFVTKGQQIPQDIEIADADRIVSLILGDEHL